MSIPTFDTLKEEYTKEMNYMTEMDKLNSSKIVDDYINIMAQTVKNNRNDIVTNRYNFKIDIKEQDLKLLYNPGFLCNEITQVFRKYNYNFPWGRFNNKTNTCDFSWVDR